jgi:hypothetical protein
MSKKRSPGRPSKYDPVNNEIVEKLCRLGVTDAELAEHFNVSESTINLWKEKHKEFSESIKRGKIEADVKVANSLFKRANGFKYKERTFEQTMITSVSEAGQLVQTPGTLVKIVEKQVAPDTTAQIFWLKNRRPKVWRDKQELAVTGNGPIIWNETKTYKK